MTGGDGQEERGFLKRLNAVADPRLESEHLSLGKHERFFISIELQTAVNYLKSQWAFRLVKRDPSLRMHCNQDHTQNRSFEQRYRVPMPGPPGLLLLYAHQKCWNIE